MTWFRRRPVDVPDADVILEEVRTTSPVRFCRECGRELVYKQQRGAIGFSDEDWIVRHCPIGNVTNHDWKVVKSWKRAPNFDPKTGEPIR